MRGKQEDASNLRKASYCDQPCLLKLPAPLLRSGDTHKVLHVLSIYVYEHVFVHVFAHIMFVYNVNSVHASLVLSRFIFLCFRMRTPSAFDSSRKTARMELAAVRGVGDGGSGQSSAQSFPGLVRKSGLKPCDLCTQKVRRIPNT